MKRLLLILTCYMCFFLPGQGQQYEFVHFNQANQPVFGGDNFRTVAVGKGGMIWAGSQYHGLVRYNPQSNGWLAASSLTDVSITDIKADMANGTIWVANAGRSGSQGGGTSIGGGVSEFFADIVSTSIFYTITSPGFLTSRNVRSLWVDKYRSVPGKTVVWVAQQNFTSSNVTQAGGISLGTNPSSPIFTKITAGLQVTPNVAQAEAATPSCLSIAGNRNEVWVFAIQNFGRSQLLRYKADPATREFIAAYDHTNTPALTSGFRANAMHFDKTNRLWIGQQSGGVIVRTPYKWYSINNPTVFPAGTVVNPNAITSDDFGNVYIGTSAGLVMYKGGPIDSTSSYTRITTSDGLPTNNINGVAVDTFAKRIILAHSSGISFMKFKNKVNFSLEWDHSFPKQLLKPVGVAADGTSRLFIKVRRSDTATRGIKKVFLALKDYTSSIASMVGKLKVANLISAYSDEANTGTTHEVSRTDSTPNGDFYFWYVAPDDFSKDSISREAQMTERVDSVKVKITYEDDSEDSSYIPIKVQRPPVYFGGGLSGIAKQLSHILKDTDPLFKDQRFFQNIGAMLGPITGLAEASRRLLDTETLTGEDREKSIPGVLEKMRAAGFASTRVDVVSHGIFGNLLRGAAAIKWEKFYANGDHSFNNYGRGFYNKMITINSPHNGSLLFDMVNELVPKIGGTSLKYLAKAMTSNPDTIKPYPVVAFKDSLFTFDPAKLAVALTSSKRFKLPETKVKNHLIVSNVELAPASPRASRSGLRGILGDIYNIVLRDASPELKAQLTHSMDSLNSQIFKSLNTLDLFASLKGLSNFTGNSDLFSHVSSQSAGQSLTLPHITTFTSDSAEQVTHEGILTLPAAGRKVANLLNTAINSAAFSDVIPANNTPEISENAYNNKPVSVFYDTNKIVTENREVISGQNLRSNNTSIILKFRVKDTVGLQYVYVNFQDSMYTTTSKARNQQVTLKVRKNMMNSGIQQLDAVGVYESADSINYHADTMRAYVVPPAVEGFRVKGEEEVELANDLPFYPTYEVKVAGKWEDLPSNDTAIKINIQRPLVLKYDTATTSINALTDGFSRVFFSYKTFKDTVAFDALVPTGKTAINRTVVNGNFKDSATWSKGRPPMPVDSIIISAGHSIVLDTTVQIRSLRIDAGGTLTLNNTNQLKLGDAGEGEFMIDNYGVLNILNGTLTVYGRVLHRPGSTFNMTGGKLVVDGNTGFTITSLTNGAFVFEAQPAMASFSFTGGTLQIVDPPLGVASQALNCPYPFGINSTLILGNGISQTASNNPNGFGGSLFPPVVGKLVLDAGTGTNNRQLNITKPLSVKGEFVVKTGSEINLQAPVTVD